MSARIFYGASRYEVGEGESVLDCLTRHGVSVPHSCRSGVCHSCLMHAGEGAIPESAQNGLKPAYKKQNLFLACQCIPETDMSVGPPDGVALDTDAVITAKDMLNAAVMRLRLATPTPYECEPGQYLTLINAAGLARSYSVANDPRQDHFIELHVRLMKDGAMSNFLLASDPGEPFVVRGPAGSCFYVPEEGDDYPIVLAATGTGLAPIYGVLRAALARGHLGPLQLFHGALREAELYYVAELQALAADHPNVRYVPCVLEGEQGRFYTAGHIEAAVMDALPADKDATRLFLCGAPDFVNSLRRKAFLGGLASKHIFADAFLPAKPFATAA